MPKRVDLELKPGMAVEAFIQTEPLPSMAYLMQPLTDQLNRAFRERWDRQQAGLNDLLFNSPSAV